MSPLSFFRKIEMVWEVISSSPLYGIAFFVLLFLVILFSTTNKSNAKQSKKTYFLIYLAVAIYFLIQYGSSIGTMIDYAINQMFLSYYFPNIVIYLGMIIIANIILWKTLFSKKANRVIRIFNSCFYGILTYLFILVVSLVQQLKLNVFQLEEMYSSNQVRSLLELSMFFFVIWMAILIVYALIRKHQQRKMPKEESPKDYTIISPFQTFTPYKLVTNAAPQHQTTPPTPVEVVQTPVVEPVKKEEPFTLEEYKVMLQILKEEKAKEEAQKKKQAEPSYDALTDLYKSIED
ncbi:MAG TPA: hypothetical protein IAC24_00845 [Candidatus Onthousia faecigallinarum]|nr:hypothetical protein [Candidatus Onthousia faecigallinarum]